MGWPGRYINVGSRGVLSVVPLQMKDTLKLFIKLKEFSSCFWDFI